MLRLFFFSIFILFVTLKLNAQESTISKNVYSFTINAPQLNTKKKIWLYLPEDYTISDKKYPVIYMHDGQNLFDQKTAFAEEWGVDETLNSLKAQVIIVGIEHGNDKRLDELTPFPNEKHGGGKGDDYLEFIVKTLKPHIDSVYRTKTKAKNTIIFGSSLGGLISYYAVLKYPDIFGKAGVFSPSFWFSEKIYEMTEKSDKIKAKIYFLCGDKESDEMVPDLKKIETLLDRNRCYCLHLTKSIIIKDGQHSEKLWRENFKEAIKWLL